MATVVLAEDYSIVREGIRELLTQTTEHEVVAECGDGLAALELVKKTSPGRPHHRSSYAWSRRVGSDSAGSSGISQHCRRGSLGVFE